MRAREVERRGSPCQLRLLGSRWKSWKFPWKSVMARVEGSGLCSQQSLADAVPTTEALGAFTPLERPRRWLSSFTRAPRAMHRCPVLPAGSVQIPHLSPGILGFVSLQLASLSAVGMREQPEFDPGPCIPEPRWLGSAVRVACPLGQGHCRCCSSPAHLRESRQLLVSHQDVSTRPVPRGDVLPPRARRHAVLLAYGVLPWGGALLPFPRLAWGGGEP